MRLAFFSKKFRRVQVTHMPSVSNQIKTRLMENNHLAFVQFSTRGKNNSFQTIQRFYCVIEHNILRFQREKDCFAQKNNILKLQSSFIIDVACDNLSHWRFCLRHLLPRF